MCVCVLIRDIAQLGRAPALGAGCRRFKSYYPDFGSFCRNKSWFASVQVHRSFERNID
jgi:hypothetical protein